MDKLDEIEEELGENRFEAEAAGRSVGRVSVSRVLTRPSPYFRLEPPRCYPVGLTDTVVDTRCSRTRHLYWHPRVATASTASPSPASALIALNLPAAAPASAFLRPRVARLCLRAHSPPILPSQDDDRGVVLCIHDDAEGWKYFSLISRAWKDRG